jgi:hypothetical protein
MEATRKSSYEHWKPLAVTAHYKWIVWIMFEVNIFPNKCLINLLHDVDDWHLKGMAGYLLGKDFVIISLFGCIIYAF